MRKILTVIVLVFCIIKTSAGNLKELIEAMAWVETRNDPNKYNEKEKAIGYLQIRPIMIREVKRLLKIEGSSTRYIHEHAWDEECFKEIFRDWARLNKYKKIAREVQLVPITRDPL